jgi:hypothetical protein
MDVRFKALSLRIEAIPSAVPFDVGLRDHEREFAFFAKAVADALVHRTVIVSAFGGGVHGRWREVSFTSDVSLAEDEWISAVEAAAKASGVKTDRSMWSLAR